MTPETSIYEYAKQGLMLSEDKPAIWFYGRAITYRELFFCVDNIAERLAALGIGHGTVVTIHLPNCPQAVMAIYAVAKLGGICNMVHPQVPLAGLRDNMNFTESNILITGNTFSECTKVDFVEKLIHVDVAFYMGAFYKESYHIKFGVRRPQNAIPFESLEKSKTTSISIPEQAALASKCVVYLHSSGTTGRPKTVMHSHQSMNCWVQNAKEYYRNTDTTKQICLSAIPPFHGIGFAMNLHRVISSGGTQVLMAKWDAKTAVHLIKKHRVTVLAGVPAMYRSLLNCKSFSGRKISQIKECFAGGDRTDVELKRAFDSRIGNGPHLFEAYGLTETVTACAAIASCHYKETASGYPLDQCYIAVLGEDGSVCPKGRGELIVSTNNMMMGYLKDPDGTKVISINQQGRTWFRTGDYGEVDEEGFVYFIDRFKHTIIRKGYNIYPKEVENVIRKQLGVKEAAVVGIYDEKTSTQDVRVCIVLMNGYEKISVEKRLVEACAQELPRYSLPSQFCFLKELPRNQIEKIDYKALEKLL